MSGFVDLHVHGGFGADFMNSPTDELVRWFDRLGEIGYRALLPTTVTAPVEAVLAAVDRLPDHPLVQGFHLEGPFLSTRYPGAQPPSAFAAIPEGPSEWDAVFDHPRLRLVTLAPEIPGALALTERLTARGVVVSMGHTDATYEQARAGAEAGVRHATHTYNAMRGLHHREPGSLGFVLTDDRVRAELIYDRVHVARPAADVLLRCKPDDGVIAVSDGTLAVGVPAGTEMTMWGLDCVVAEHDVRLRSNGALAGSTITLADAYRNLAEDFGEATARWLCCDNPARAIGLPVLPAQAVSSNPPQPM
jgi:N-acetylglucosamine-6-phosphate deacetylase